jgi:hypothetical protein
LISRSPAVAFLPRRGPKFVVAVEDNTRERC